MVAYTFLNDALIADDKSIDGRQLFNLFRNVISYAFFRQTTGLCKVQG